MGCGHGAGLVSKKNPAHSPERKEEGPALTWAADAGAGSRRAVGLVSQKKTPPKGEAFTRLGVQDELDRDGHGQ